MHYHTDPEQLSVNTNISSVRGLNRDPLQSSHKMERHIIPSRPQSQTLILNH